MESPAPERFCGVGRRRAKAVAVPYGRALRRTCDAKDPGPFGVTFRRAPAVSRRSTDGHCIALRAAPCGSRSPERNAGCFHLRRSCSDGPVSVPSPRYRRRRRRSRNHGLACEARRSHRRRRAAAGRDDRQGDGGHDVAGRRHGDGNPWRCGQHGAGGLGAGGDGSGGRSACRPPGRTPKQDVAQNARAAETRRRADIAGADGSRSIPIPPPRPPRGVAPWNGASSWKT